MVSECPSSRRQVWGLNQTPARSGCTLPKNVYLILLYTIPLRRPVGRPASSERFRSAGESSALSGRRHGRRAGRPRGLSMDDPGAPLPAAALDPPARRMGPTGGDSSSSWKSGEYEFFRPGKFTKRTGARWLTSAETLQRPRKERRDGRDENRNRQPGRRGGARR